MSDATTIELKDIDLEDISDVLVKVEKSFGFNFDNTELKDVKTFGELCDIMTIKVEGYYNVNDCTSQQGFYKLCNAITATLGIDKDSVTTDTNLRQLFPRHNRRQKIKDLQNELDMTVDILDIQSWLGWTIFIGITCSLIMFFFSVLSKGLLQTTVA